MLIVTQTNLFSFGVKKIPAVQNDGETNFEKSFDVKNLSFALKNLMFLCHLLLWLCTVSLYKHEAF